MRGYLLLLEARALFLTHVCIVIPLKISHKDHPQIIHYATHSSNNSVPDIILFPDTGTYRCEQVCESVSPKVSKHYILLPLSTICSNSLTPHCRSL